MDKPGRNDPCHCGSGQKYKKCCLAKDESERVARLAQQPAAAEPPAAAPIPSGKRPPGKYGQKLPSGGGQRPSGGPPPGVRRKAT